MPPIRPENKPRYPKDWKLRSRFVREVRAGSRCEWCGVPQYAVGQRVDGLFVQVKGNAYLDQMLYASSHQEARALADHLNQWNDELERYIVIVLTVAHIHARRPPHCSTWPPFASNVTTVTTHSCVARIAVRATSCSLVSCRCFELHIVSESCVGPAFLHARGSYR